MEKSRLDRLVDECVGIHGEDMKGWCHDVIETEEKVKGHPENCVCLDCNWLYTLTNT